MQGDPQSHGLWEATAPPPPETRPLEGATRADVAIVGGGYTGLSAALKLAEAGSDAVVLEAQDIGFGGSGRNAGLLNAGLWLKPSEVKARLGEDYGERLLARLEEAPALVFSLIEKHGIACEALHNGTLHCARDDAGLREIKERDAEWQARGADVVVLRAEETAALTGTTRYVGALHDRRAGTIQPLAYARGLAKAAQAAGARLHTESPVEACAREGGAWRLTTPQGEVRAEQVIIGTNAYNRGPWPQLSAAQIPFHYTHFATPPLDESLRATILPQRHGCWDTRLMMTSVRYDAAGRLIVGSLGKLEQGGAAVLMAWAQREMVKLYPQLAGTPWQHQWQGRIAMTEDRLPHFHELAPGMITCSGYNGRGMGPGTTFGKMMAEQILGGRNEPFLLPASSIKPASLRGLKSAAYEIGARAFHLFAARR